MDNNKYIIWLAAIVATALVLITGAIATTAAVQAQINRTHPTVCTRP